MMNEEETKQQKRENKRVIIQIVFLFLMLVVIILMIVAITTLIKNKDIIQKDPLRYGMDVHDFVSCDCIDSKGIVWYSFETGFKTERRGEGWINYSNLRIDPDIINEVVVNASSS